MPDSAIAPANVAPVRTWDFIQATRAWYHQASATMYASRGIVEEVNVRQYTDGDFEFEFTIAWYDLQGRPTPRVNVFSDSWLAFQTMRPLFEALAERDSLSVTECTDLLVHLFNATDATETVNPRAVQEPQDWVILADGVVIASGPEEKMREAFEAVSAGRSVPLLPPVSEHAAVGLVHVEAARPGASIG